MIKLMIFGIAIVTIVIGGAFLLTPKEVSEDYEKLTEHWWVSIFSPAGIKWAGWVFIVFGVVFAIVAFVA